MIVIIVWDSFIISVRTVCILKMQLLKQKFHGGQYETIVKCKWNILIKLMLTVLTILCRLLFLFKHFFKFN